MSAESTDMPAVNPTASTTEKGDSIGFLAHWRGILRVAIGVLGPFAIIGAAAGAHIADSDSAVQVIQIYMGHLYDVITITAVCIVLYILSKAGD